MVILREIIGKTDLELKRNRKKSWPLVKTKYRNRNLNSKKEDLRNTIKVPRRNISISDGDDNIFEIPIDKKLTILDNTFKYDDIMLHVSSFCSSRN